MFRLVCVFVCVCVCVNACTGMQGVMYVCAIGLGAQVADEKVHIHN